MTIIYNNQKQNLKNYSLIWPIISIGNVGQLSMELLLNHFSSTNDLEYYGYFYDEYILPCIGFSSYRKSQENSDMIAKPIEFYIVKSQNIVLASVISSFIKGKTSVVAKRIFEDFIKLHNFSNIIMLSSLSQGLCKSINIDHISRVQFWSNQEGEKKNQLFSKIIESNNNFELIDFTTLESCCGDEKISSFVKDSYPENVHTMEFKCNATPIFNIYTEIMDCEDKNVIVNKGWDYVQNHGGIFSTVLLDMASDNNTLCICLFIFCAEGDNTLHAIKVANAAYFTSCCIAKNQICQEEKIEWKIPIYWNIPM